MCQSKKIWNEEEDHGPGEMGVRGDSEPDDVEQGQKQVWRDKLEETLMVRRTARLGGDSLWLF